MAPSNPSPAVAPWLPMCVSRVVASDCTAWCPHRMHYARGGAHPLQTRLVVAQSAEQTPTLGSRSRRDHSCHDARIRILGSVHHCPGRVEVRARPDSSLAYICEAEACRHRRPTVRRAPPKDAGWLGGELSWGNVKSALELRFTDNEPCGTACCGGSQYRALV